MNLSWRQWRDPEAVIVCGLGSGFVPRAPGTCGSFAALVLWWWLLAPLSIWWQLTAIAAIFGLGIWLCGRVQKRYGVVDDGAIVIDEFAGQWIALLGAGAEPVTMIGAFILFRIFDILKPYPVKKLERSLPGPWGVMMDDVAAGVLALGVLEFALWGLAGVYSP